MSKLKYNSDAREMIIGMCNGNPGAIKALLELIARDEVDGFVDIHRLGDAGIYGPNIWIAYNDICGLDRDRFHEAISDGSIEGLVKASKYYVAA